MRAVQFSPDAAFELVDIERPRLSRGEVRLRVDACGVCGSDRQVVQGESVPPGTTFPLVMGHEIAGTIIEIGDDVADWKVGLPVVVHPFVACGTCAACQHQQPNLCVRQVCIGYQSPGGFAEEVVIPSTQLVAAPERCSPQAAALLVDAFATPYHAMKLSGVQAGSTLLVIGTGGLGLAALRLGTALGVTRLGAVTRRATGRAIAEEFGASMVISTEDDARTVARQVRRWSGAGGIDVVLDTVATTQTVALAMDVVRLGGTVTLVGMSEDEVPYPVAKTVRRGVRLQGSYGSVREDIEELLGLVASELLHPDALVAGTLSLEDTAQAFSPARTSGRFVILPNGSDYPSWGDFHGKA